MTELVKKTLYKGRTIFEYKTGNKRYWMLQAGLSSHKYTTLEGAKRAIDRGTARKRR